MVPLNYIAIQDVGTAINPATVEGQLEGGAVQAVGWGLFEGIALGRAGHADDGEPDGLRHPEGIQAPQLGTVLVNVPSEQGPYGAKGVGEPPVIPGAAALANAVYEAVRRARHGAADDLRAVIGALALGKNGAAHTNGTVTAH